MAAEAARAKTQDAFMVLLSGLLCSLVTACVASAWREVGLEV